MVPTKLPITSSSTKTKYPSTLFPICLVLALCAKKHPHPWVKKIHRKVNRRVIRMVQSRVKKEVSCNLENTGHAQILLITSTCFTATLLYLFSYEVK